MKKIFTLLLSFIAVTMAMAQNQEGVFKKASVAPVMDGVVDAVWDEANVYNIERTVTGETPTIGAAGESTWQALWNEEGVYVLLKIADNAFFPNYAPGGGANNWEYDKAEIYFDVNANLEDGIGPEKNNGHYQFAPGFVDGKNNGTPITDNGFVHAFMVDGSNYILEYFVPFTRLKDVDNVIVDKTATIGFDVTFIDRDPGDAKRNQAVWSNTGASWTNMDAAGRVTFEGAEQDVLIDDIQLTGGTITQNKGTLQIGAVIVPANATYKDLIWSVENGTGKAIIDQKGMLTALTDGTVTVTAKSSDAQGMTASVEVTISGQSVSRNDIWNNFNLIKNFNFDTDISSWSGWYDGVGQIPPVVNDGIVALTTVTAAEQWHYQFNQSPLAGEANVPYVLKFKSWSDVERANTVDFEDTGSNGNRRYGATTDPESGDGRSEWHYTTTPDPQWFTFHVTFDDMKESTVQKLCWLLSQADGTTYLDSVLLVTQAEYDLLQTLPATGVKSMANSIKNVYPNPVAKTLNVELSAVNSKVAIYNAIGQKLMEKTSFGNKVTFDVSSLRRGMYFIKLEDGSTQKFIK